MKKPTQRSAYDPAAIEPKWQKKWAKDKTYKTQDGKAGKDTADKFYVLDMFPYPSGEGLHVGHPKGYIATDVISRIKRMQGMNVLHPMGFDAFGLPAENYAIKTKTNPEIAVAKNVAHYKEQLELLGFDYDWSREVNTTDPKFYKWTQWIFLQLLKKGLAYESNEPVNWCPVDKTVLANEDVEDGRCERCGAIVEKKPMRQWVLRITDYADRMLRDLDAKKPDGTALLDWPESIKESQRNWIGRSEGAEIDFELMFTKNPADNDRRGPNGEKAHITVFTTRADTLFGVTYVVLAPEHPWVRLAADDTHDVLENKVEVRAYLDGTARKTEIERMDATKEKTGVELKGVKAINPATGEEVPMYVADYVLGDYGTGAVMAVPAHDERDADFAKKHDLPSKHVIAPYFLDATKNSKPRPGIETKKRDIAVGIVKHWSEDKYMMLDWKNGWTGFITGGIESSEKSEDAIIREIREETGYKNVKFIRHLEGSNVSDFYAPHKKLNQQVQGYGMYLELQDDSREEVLPEEHAKHTLVWKTKDEVQPFLKKGSPMGDSRYSELFWNKFITGNYTWTGKGKLINSGTFSGSNSNEARSAITKKFGRMVVKYKLRDWVFSRQRYWGEPIPVIHCEKCGVVPVPEKDLPVKLPKVESYEPTGTGESPLAAIEKWVNVKCPQCKGAARRETNTMPQWAGSSWYYLRYMDPDNKKALVDLKKETYWSPVDLYVGGAEHATRHLIYARFWHKFLYDIGAVSGIEPFAKLQSVGLIMAEDGRKMSKRFGNVVNPDDIVKQFGADTLRVYEMFMGPFDQAIAWSTDNMVGSRRFIERAWKLADKVTDDAKAAPSVGENRIIHKAIKKVSDDIGDMRFNTAISTLMIALNELEKQTEVSRASYEIYLKLLAPFAPHAAEELWAGLGNKKSIHVSEWPAYDPALTVETESSIILQINGKTRGSFMAAAGTATEELERMARSAPEALKWLEGKQVRRIIVVPGKLVNIVVQ